MPYGGMFAAQPGAGGMMPGGMIAAQPMVMTPGGGVMPAAGGMMAVPAGMVAAGMPPPPGAVAQPGGVQGGNMSLQMMAAASRYDTAKDVYKQYFNVRFGQLQKAVESAAGRDQ